MQAANGSVCVCANGDKNTAAFLFLSATLVLHMLPKLAPCV